MDLWYNTQRFDDDSAGVCLEFQEDDLPSTFKKPPQSEKRLGDCTSQPGKPTAEYMKNVETWKQVEYPVPVRICTKMGEKEYFYNWASIAKTVTKQTNNQDRNKPVDCLANTAVGDIFMIAGGPSLLLRIHRFKHIHSETSDVSHAVMYKTCNDSWIHLIHI